MVAFLIMVLIRLMSTMVNDYPTQSIRMDLVAVR
jgi:hypothetical protein